MHEAIIRLAASLIGTSAEQICRMLLDNAEEFVQKSNEPYDEVAILPIINAARRCFFEEEDPEAPTADENVEQVEYELKTVLQQLEKRKLLRNIDA